MNNGYNCLLSNLLINLPTLVKIEQSQIEGYLVLLVTIIIVTRLVKLGFRVSKTGG